MSTTDPDIVEKVSAVYAATVELPNGKAEPILLYETGRELIPSKPPWMSLMEWLRSGEVSFITIEGL